MKNKFVIGVVCLFLLSLVILSSCFAPASRHNNLALALVNDARYDEAIVEATAAIEIAPSNASAYFQRGLAYAMTGRQDAALDDFSAAVRYDPAMVEAYSRRAEIYVATGRADAPSMTIPGLSS